MTIFEYHQLGFYFYIFVTLLLFVALLGGEGKDRDFGISYVSSFFSVLLCGVAVVLISALPAEVSFDKTVYEAQFTGAIYLDEFRDIGWALYIAVCRGVLGANNSNLFFILTAILYCSGYYIFFNKTLDERTSFYAVGFSMICMGFISYGNNTTRAGLAISMLLIALSRKNINLSFILISILSIFIHKSMFIPIAAYVLCSFVPNTKIYIRFWLFMLLISILNIDLSSVFSYLELADERVSGYMIESINNENSLNLYQKAGFRIDFIIYSMIPMVAGWFYIYKLRYEEQFYHRIYNTYIAVNAIWLLVIRIPFTDRFAYLSWFLMPIIMIYPLIDKNHVVENRQLLLFIVVIVFFGYQTINYIL